MSLKANIIHKVGANLSILTNAISLVGTTAVTSGLGFFYWWVAARQFQPAAVGLASAAISAMTLLGTLATLGLGTLLMGEIPRQQGQKRSVGSLITTASLLAALVGCILGFLFTFTARFISPELRVISDEPGNMLLFTLGVGLTAFVLVLDQAMIGLLKGNFQLGRNTIFAATKLVLLIGVGLLVSDRLGMSIFATWFVGILASLIGLAGFVRWRGFKIRLFYRPRLETLHGFIRTTLTHHVLNLALQASALILPLIVTGILSATSNAHFYLAWMIAGFVFVGPLALSTMLYAVGAAEPALLVQKLRFTLRIAALLGLATNLGLWLGADILLNLFGESYQAEASWCLRLLGLSVFPLIIKDHYVAVCRIEGPKRIAVAATWVSLGSILELVLAALGANLIGLTGVSLGWLTAVCVEAAFMFSPIYKLLRYTPTEKTLPVVESNV